MKQIRVLLIEGGDQQVLPLAKSMKKLGCHVTTYNTSKLDPGYASKYPDQRILSYFEADKPEESLRAIEKVLKEYSFDIVVPLNDFVAAILSKYKKELEKYATITVNDWEIFQKASDKSQTMKICMDNEIPCPYTFTNLDDFKKAENVKYPVVVKPRTGFGAVGFHVSQDQQDAERYFEAATKKFGPCLIQEYIPQTDLQYKAELYVDREGSLKAACVFSKLRWYPIDGGSSTLNVTVDRPDIISDCKRLLKAINWRGYADIDLIQDPRDGIAKIMEINPRITGSVKICYEAGVNFSKLMLQDYQNEVVDSAFDVKYGTYLRYFHKDILWFLKSKDRFKCKPSWFNFWNSCDQILSWDDMKVGFTYSIQSIQKLIHDKKRRSVDNDK